MFIFLDLGIEVACLPNRMEIQVYPESKFVAVDTRNGRHKIKRREPFHGDITINGKSVTLPQVLKGSEVDPVTIYGVLDDLAMGLKDDLVDVTTWNHLRITLTDFSLTKSWTSSSSYIEKFPTGRFAADARNYLKEEFTNTLMKQGDRDTALISMLNHPIVPMSDSMLIYSVRYYCNVYPESANMNVLVVGNRDCIEIKNCSDPSLSANFVSCVGQGILSFDARYGTKVDAGSRSIESVDRSIRSWERTTTTTTFWSIPLSASMHVSVPIRVGYYYVVVITGLAKKPETITGGGGRYSYKESDDFGDMTIKIREVHSYKNSQVCFSGSAKFRP